MDINLLLRDAGLNQTLGRLLPNDRLVRELLSSLRPGQVLEAQVLSTPRVDLARLLLEGLSITARTGRPLRPGQLLTLTVLKGGSTPELRVQLPPQPAGSQDVLRLALPRQLPLHETLSELARLAGRAAPLLGAPAREALQKLLDRSLPLRSVSPDTLRQAVKDSGIFTEARMARGEAPAATDRKALLLQLAGALPPRDQPADEGPLPAALTRATLASAGALPDPLTRASLIASLLDRNGGTLLAGQTPAPQPTASPEQTLIDRLWRLVDASLARIQTHQAHSLPADDKAPPGWHMDIPLALPGGPTQALEMRIQREPAAEDHESAEGGWLVTVGFLFPRLGPVKAAVRLSGGRISTVFWCEHPAAARLFERQLPQLRSALEAVGLDVSHLAASQGRPPVQAGDQEKQRLLDERV